MRNNPYPTDFIFDRHDDYVKHTPCYKEGSWRRDCEAYAFECGMENPPIKSNKKTPTLNTSAKRYYSTSCVDKKMTERQLDSAWIESLQEMYPTAKDFITHYKHGFDVTSHNRFATLDLETVKLPQHKNIQLPSPYPVREGLVSLTQLQTD